MIRDTTKPVIHSSTEAPLWDPNFLLPGRNCFALHSRPCIIIYSRCYLCSSSHSPAILPSSAATSQAAVDWRADVCYYHPSDPFSSASLQPARPIYSRCRLIPEKVGATAQTNHSNAARYTVTCKYVQTTQREDRRRSHKQFVFHPCLGRWTEPRNYFIFPPMSL